MKYYEIKAISCRKFNNYITGTGTVKFFNDFKGFGFVKEDSTKKILCHSSGLKSFIKENDRVNVDLEMIKMIK